MPSVAASASRCTLRQGSAQEGVTTNYLYDGLNPVQEKSGATITANLLTGLGIGQVFTRTDSVGMREFFSDALGSTLALADTSANSCLPCPEPSGRPTSRNKKLLIPVN